MKRVSLFSIAICGTLVGCGSTPFASGPASGPRVVVQPPDEGTLRPPARPLKSTAGLGQTGRSAAALDTTTAAERAAAQAAPQGTGLLLGETLASLGSPTEQGFWLRTGLVTQVQQGRVERADGAGALRLELRPSGNAPDAGSQISLAAIRALNAPLTQLLPLRVFAD